MRLTTERDVDQLRTGLSRWLGRPVHDITRPDPGYSCETLVVDNELVFRLPPVGDAIFPDYDLATQARVQQSAADAGVPIARPTYEGDPDFLGTPFIAMPFVEGPIPGEFTAGDRWLKSLPDDRARHQVWRSLLDALALIHTVPAHGLRTGLAEELGYWTRYLDWATDGHPPGGLADCLAWCRDHRPRHEPPAGLLWGDVRLGNIVFDPDTYRPRAVLDWDMVSAGPPEMDLAWFLALEQVQQDLSGTRVPGFGSADEAAAVLGTRAALQWYEIFALVRASAVTTRIAILYQRHGKKSMFEVGRDPAQAAAAARIEKV